MDFQSDFFLAGWKIQPSMNRIVKGGLSRTLEHRVMRVLLCLAEHAPEPVTREHLLKVAWPDLHTSEHSLTTVISDLRKIFEDDPRRPRMIETIRKIGYRLMVEPVAIEEDHVVVISQTPQKKRRIPFWTLLLTPLLLALVFLLFFRHSKPTFAAKPEYVLSPQPLTSYPGGEFDPTLSPQGNALAFVWVGDTKNFDIYLKDLNGESPRRLTETRNFDGSPVWSPDGQKIAFMSSDNQECGIYITTLTGGDLRRVADCTHHDESAIDWSPDGRFLVFADRPAYGSPSQLYQLDLVTELVEPLTQPSADLVGDRDPIYAPDGQSLAFVRGTLPSTVAPEISPVFGDIHIMDLKTRRIRQVTHENVEIPGVTWTPDGQHLVFASNRDGSGYGLWQVPIDGGTPQVILRGKDLIRNPIISRQQRFLVYEDWERDTNIWRIPLREQDPEAVRSQQFIVSTRWESHPEYSPDGHKIAFASKRSGHTEIWVCQADGLQPQKITNFRGPYVNVPRWSPDGKALAFEVREGNQSHIYRVNMLGKNPPIPVSQGDYYDLAPSWSQDGSMLYFGSNRSGNWQVWSAPASGGKANQVTEKGGFQAFELGDYLYFAHLNRRGIWRQPLQGGSAEAIIADTLAQDWDNWVVKQDGIYFIKRPHLRKATFSFFPFPNGPVQELMSFETHRVLGKNGLTVSPDGKWALFTKLDKLTGDLMMLQEPQAPSP